MDNDDELIGRMWTRKEVMRLLGGAGALALAVGCGNTTDNVAYTGDGVAATTVSPVPITTASVLATATPTPTPTPIVIPSATPLPSPVPNVVFTPALTEGPFFVDEKINRSDIRGDSTRSSVVNGRPLTFAFRVQQVVGATISPFVGAQVDIWHADAAGTYSDENNPGVQSENTLGQNYLRGYQITDSNGMVNFTTIYPGWYQGRTIHIHIKIRNGSYVINTQLFFDDAFSDTIVNAAPYNLRGNRTVRNANDGIFQENSGGVTAGSKLTLVVTETGTALASAYTFGLAM